jgi:hypothetical protein
VSSRSARRRASLSAGGTAGVVGLPEDVAILGLAPDWQTKNESGSIPTGSSGSKSRILYQTAESHSLVVQWAASPPRGPGSQGSSILGGERWWSGGPEWPCWWVYFHGLLHVSRSRTNFTKTRVARGRFAAFSEIAAGIQEWILRDSYWSERESGGASESPGTQTRSDVEDPGQCNQLLCGLAIYAALE